jgi:arabinofuranosyltransferase
LLLLRRLIERVIATPTSDGFRDSRLVRGAYVCAAILLSTFIVRTAWICDDAYITARTIDNFWHGHGLRWNTVERVQVFTHPLWLFVEALAWRLSGGFYWSSLAVSIVFSCAAGLLLTAIEGVSFFSAAALFFLSSSQAFVDFATSGLETPLSYLLWAALLVVYVHRRSSPDWAFGTTTLVSLLAVNRLDSLVLAAPILIHVMLVAGRAQWRRFVIGLTPLLLWEAFATVYYGFPLPNTAYAKLATGIPQSELTTQGMAYLQNSWKVDPPTLAIVVTALAAAAWSRRPESLTVAGGLFLHLVYVLRVGGDFMSGRFLAPAVVVAVGLLLGDARTSSRKTVYGLVMLVVAGVAYPHALSRVWPARPLPSIDRLIGDHGIADERLIYARDTGMLRALRLRAVPQPAWEQAGRAAAAAGVTAMSRDSVGLFGYGAGSSVHIVDTLALCDPLLARLPADRPWRIGHFHRPIPGGYMDMLRAKQDRLEDPGLNAYFLAVREVTRGPLWSLKRWSAIVYLNTTGVRAP